MNDFISFIGYSGHSYVCIEIAKLNGLSPFGYYDLSKKSKNPYKLKFLGSERKNTIEQTVFISVGSNQLRREILEGLSDHKFMNVKLIHPNSSISKSAKIGIQSLVCAKAVINPQVKIGRGVILNTGSIVEHDCKIDDFSHIATGAVLAGNVSIGKGSFIGANSVIKQGVKIGDNAIIGAGSVVLNDIQNNLTVVGNPAKTLYESK